MSTQQAVSFCLCCFWQAVRRLWSLHMSGIHLHAVIHSSSNVYLTSWFILSVLFFHRWWDICAPYPCLGSPIKYSVKQTSTPVVMATQPADSFCLCCFWQAVRHLWSLNASGIPCHTDLCPGMNVYLTSWLIQSVLFLTGSETSHGPRPWKECLPDQLVHCVCVVFDRRSDICGPYNCPGTPITPTSTLVGMSTWPAGSFCLCCFWQVVRHLWSLHMSGNPHHMDLHPGRNVYLSSWFILSVLFLTGGETSVVPTCVLDPPLHRSPPE